MRLVLFALVTLAPACALESSSTDALGRCAVLENRDFKSVATQPDCGLGPDGAGACHWTIRFRALENETTEFQYHYSDVIESGSTRCTLTQNVDVVIGTDTEYGGRFQSSTQHLIWDGIVFEPSD